MFATVVKGKLEIQLKRKSGSGWDTLASFEPNDIEGLAKFFKEHDVISLICSSSVDFPVDDGMPKGVDVRGWMKKAWDFNLVKITRDQKEQMQEDIMTHLDGFPDDLINELCEVVAKHTEKT